MDQTRSFEVWLAVKLRVEVRRRDGGEPPWSGDAVARGASWLAGMLRDSADDAADITVTAGPADLTDAAVRMLNQMGEERRHGGVGGGPSPAGARVDGDDGAVVAAHTDDR